MKSTLIAILLLSGTCGALGEAPDNYFTHLQCIETNIGKFDDGKIAPEEIAKLIVPLCHDVYLREFERFNKGKVPTPEEEQTETVRGVVFVRSRPLPAF
jgi:hypothetical protein